MKKIINRKLYDTDTAQVIGADGNGYGASDFNCVCETLYRKRTGEYFLHGEGGARSRYASREGNMWGWGQQIIPLTYDEARDWAEEHLNADEYAEAFGMPDEGDESKTILTITIPATKATALRQGAEKAGLSLSAYIDSIIQI